MKIKRRMKKIPLLLVFLFSAMLTALSATPVRAEGTPALPGLANWFVEGSGTYFEMTSSQYVNVTLTSSETVHMILESVPRMVSFFIERNSSATSTLLTLSGFETNATYYRHQDGYLMEEFTTDSNGEYAYTQDISEAHHVYIQEYTSTLYINSDYTFTSDIYEPIVVVADNIVIDGNGYTLQGPGSGYGFYLSGSATIKNVIVNGWTYGVRMRSVNTICNNTITNNQGGIQVWYGNSNNVSDNTVSNNNRRGIQMGAIGSPSNHNEIRGNLFLNNGLGYQGDGAVLLAGSYNLVTANTFQDNREGITLWGDDDNPSIYNTFSHNYFLSNVFGIAFARWADHNTITGNTIILTGGHGIYIQMGSDYNLVSDNTISNNRYGIILFGIEDNTIYHNNIIDNGYQAWDSNPEDNNWHHPVLLEGNYWSDYPGFDDGSGTGKHAIAGDGIGDTHIPWPEPDYDYYPFTWARDTTPPTTEISLDGILGACGWYISDVTVTLTASDWVTGVDKTEYSFDQVVWMTYTTPLTIATEGMTVIYYRSIDNRGNVEATKSETIKIDKTAPEITITSPEPRDYLENETLAIQYGAADTASGIASVNATLGYDPAIIRIEPYLSTAMVFTSFTIDINIEEVSDLNAWIVFPLEWDPTLLDVVQWTEGPFLRMGGLTTFLYTVHQEAGYIGLACVLSEDASVSGSGTLATLTFFVEAEGESVLHLHDTRLYPPGWVDEIHHETIDGYFTGIPLPEEHDMAITSVTASPTKVTAGEPVTVTAVVENQGTRTETFNVTVFYDSTQIATETDISLTWGESTTLTFTWDTTGIGRPGAYTISAEVSVVPGEIETVDNTLVDDVVNVMIRVDSGEVFDLSCWRLGKYILTVTAIDNACNEAVESVTFTVATTLSGVVTDEYTKEPIPGVTISILETDESIVTDEFGRYSFFIRAVGVYTVEMTVPYGYLTHDDVTKFAEVIEATEVNFTLYQASWSGATVPRTIGYWKNWDNHYTREMMETFVAHVKSASGLFSDLTVDDVKSYLKMGRFSMERKGQTQLLASWLNVVSAQLGVDVQVDLSSIEGWEQVITIPDGSILTVDELLKQIDNFYLTDADLTKEQWEIVKDILDALNNGQLFVEE